MGYSHWDASSWESYSTRHVNNKTSVSGGGSSSLYQSTAMPDDMNPKNITVRESRDSHDNPNSTPIIIALDVTGSMSPVLRSVITNLNTLMQEIYNRGSITDPQVCFMAVGDADYDLAPLQVSQFESDIRIAEALQKVWYEGRGGGNSQESYTLPWYFATNYVSADAIEKRHKKGILITMGDEPCPDKLTRRQIQKVFGTTIEEDSISSEELLNAVSRDWDVFHLIIEQGNYYSNRYRYHDTSLVDDSFGELLGERAIHVSDYNKIAEIVVSILEALAGKDIDAICDSWDGSTGIVVRKAIEGLATTENNTATAVNGLVEF